MKNKIPWNLIIGKLKNSLDPKEEQELNEWLADADNQEIFDRLFGLWEGIQLKKNYYRPDEIQLWNKLSLKLGFGSEKQQDSKSVYIRKMWKYAAAVILVIGMSSLFFYMGHQLPVQKVTAQGYTNLSGKSKVYLPDGTEVWLHTNSSISYKSDFNSTNRDVTVSGEAYFNVQHDKENPFIVRSNELFVKVHGTQFNIESLTGSENIIVSLVSGSVLLETPKERQFMEPGQMAIYNRRNRSLKIQKGDVEYAKSWIGDQIYFEQKSLGYICRYLSKWYNIKIDLNSSLQNKYAYTFTLRDEPLDEVLRIMSRINPIQYEFTKENVLIINEK